MNEAKKGEQSRAMKEENSSKETVNKRANSNFDDIENEKKTPKDWKLHQIKRWVGLYTLQAFP